MIPQSLVPKAEVLPPSPPSRNEFQYVYGTTIQTLTIIIMVLQKLMHSVELSLFGDGRVSERAEYYGGLSIAGKYPYEYSMVEEANLRRKC